MRGRTFLLPRNRYGPGPPSLQKRDVIDTGSDYAVSIRMRTEGDQQHGCRQPRQS
jgi:hypothetical protein